MSSVPQRDLFMAMSVPQRRAKKLSKAIHSSITGSAASSQLTFEMRIRISPRFHQLDKANYWETIQSLYRPGLPVGSGIFNVLHYGSSCWKQNTFRGHTCLKKSPTPPKPIFSPICLFLTYVHLFNLLTFSLIILVANITVIFVDSRLSQEVMTVQ